MKKVLFAFVLAAAFTACGGGASEAPATETVDTTAAAIDTAAKAIDTAAAAIDSAAKAIDTTKK